jgi:hypothetical protein
VHSAAEEASAAEAAASACEGCTSQRAPAGDPLPGHPANDATSASAAAAEDFPALNGGTSSSAQQDGKGGKKNKKVPKFERLRLTGGDPAATLNFLETGGGTRVKPQNAWTQGCPAVSRGGGGSAQPRGQWAQQGKVATEWRNINDSRSKK